MHILQSAQSVQRGGVCGRRGPALGFSACMYFTLTQHGKRIGTRATRVISCNTTYECTDKPRALLTPLTAIWHFFDASQR